MESTTKKRVYRKMTMSVKCMVFYENKILLLQKNDKEGKLPWEFPGGGLEFGEDLRTAALREVKEETGLSVDLLDIIGTWSYRRTENIFLTGAIFIARAKTKEIILSQEHRDYCWIKPREMKNFTLQDSLQKALEGIKIPDENGLNLRQYFVKNFNA